jgi:hypothetical protein
MIIKEWKEVVLYLGMILLAVIGSACHALESHMAGEVVVAVAMFAVGRFIPTRSDAQSPGPNGAPQKETAP